MERPTVDVLDYEKIVADFEHRLVTQLRGHGTDADYLEMWVPDDDPVKSILNMIEAADAYGQREIAIRVAAKSVSPQQVKTLMAHTTDLADIAVTQDDGRTFVLVARIKGQR